MSARELKRELKNADKEMKEVFLQNQNRQKKRHALIDSLPKETADLLNKLRLAEDDDD